MNVQNLQDRYPLLLKFLKENGYSKFYVRRFKSEIDHILNGVKLSKWNSYVDVYHSYTKRSNSVSYLKEKRSIISAIERFDLDNLYPGRSHRAHILKENGMDLLSEEFKDVIKTYCKIAGAGDKKETTIYTESHNATTFLLSLQEQRIFSLKSITERSVLGVFFQNGKLRRSCSYKKNVAAVFKSCIPFFPDNICATILSYLPALREKRANIQYLTKIEIATIKAVLIKSDLTLSLRDKAIGQLALYTGLRSCDMAGLTLSDIDWKKDLIRMRQQKTEVPLDLPLSATVGNAIYSYIMNERPKTHCQEVFVTQTIPITRLHRGSMWNISNKIMQAAGIRQRPGDRRGFHIFRHHMATSLLEKGVPQPVISQTMGHRSPASLNPYLMADFVHLKECAISIGSFPLRKGVLS